jgi:hypothetical protein
MNVDGNPARKIDTMYVSLHFITIIYIICRCTERCKARASHM